MTLYSKLAPKLKSKIVEIVKEDYFIGIFTLFFSLVIPFILPILGVVLAPLFVILGIVLIFISKQKWVTKVLTVLIVSLLYYFLSDFYLTFLMSKTSNF